MKALLYRDVLANKTLPLSALVMLLFAVVIGGSSSPTTLVINSSSIVVTYCLIAVITNGFMTDKRSHADRYYLAAPLSPHVIVGQRFLSIYGATALLIAIYLVLAWIKPLPLSSPLFATMAGLLFLTITGISTAIGYATSPVGFTTTLILLCFGGVAFFLLLVNASWAQSFIDDFISLATTHPNVIAGGAFLLTVVMGAVLYKLSVWIYRHTVN